MEVAHFFPLSCNDVTFVDGQSWISIHNYVVIDWKCIPILLTLKRVVDGGTINNLTLVIMQVVKTFGGLPTKDI